MKLINHPILKALFVLSIYFGFDWAIKSPPLEAKAGNEKKVPECEPPKKLGDNDKCEMPKKSKKR